MAEAVGAAARREVALRRAATVVVLGGDTAAAVVGDRPVRVHGSLGVGIAAGELDIDGRTVTLIAKPGGFGHADTVVDLMPHLLHARPRPDDGSR